MSDDDILIRERLGPLRRAPVPPLPAILPARPPRRDPSWHRLAAAAAMLLALPAALYLVPPRDEKSSAPVSRRMVAVEARLSEVRDETLRSLLRREIDLLRRELRLVEEGR